MLNTELCELIRPLCERMGSDPTRTVRVIVDMNERPPMVDVQYVDSAGLARGTREEITWPFTEPPKPSASPGRRYTA